MFLNLKAEMARKNLKIKNIAETIGLSQATVSGKIKGIYEFTRTEMFKIKKTHFNDLTLEYLFEKEKETNLNELPGTLN